MSNTSNQTEATPVKAGRPRPVYTWFPLNTEERKVIDSASRDPLAWHGYLVSSSETKTLSSLGKKGIIEFHPTQNLFRILPSALKR